MTDDELKLYRALITTAGTLAGASEFSTVYIGRTEVVPLSAESVRGIAKLLDQAAEHISKSWGHYDRTN